MENDIVSIGIPMYNAEKFIKYAINSVLSQTYQNFELIITDDGSTDKSVEIVRSFDDKRIKLILDGQNKGISFRLNQQINLAKGNFFVRMDADDIMFPNRLEKQIDFLKNNPNIDVVGSSIVILDDENNIIAFRNAILQTEYRKLFNNILFNHPTVTGKTVFFKNFYYNEEYLGVEDLDLWLRSFPKSNFFVMEEPVLFYRDPLVFKLKTYKFRLTQKNKLLKKNEYLSKHPFYRFVLIQKNNLKKVIATILNLFRIDYILISNRNSMKKPIKKEWQLLLNNILNEK